MVHSLYCQLLAISWLALAYYLLTADLHVNLFASKMMFYCSPVNERYHLPLWYFIYLRFRGNHSCSLSHLLVRRVRLLRPYVTNRSFSIRAASCGVCAAHADCHTLVYFQWLRRKRRKRRRELVKKRQIKVGHWWTFLLFLLNLLDLGKAPRWFNMDDVSWQWGMKTSVWKSLCVTCFNTDGQTQNTQYTRKYLVPGQWEKRWFLFMLCSYYAGKLSGWRSSGRRRKRRGWSRRLCLLNRKV